jgi:hypothetical protein
MMKKHLPYQDFIALCREISEQLSVKEGVFQP